MVEELDAHVAIDGEHPIADLVNLVDQLALGHIEAKGHDGYGLKLAQRQQPRRSRSRGVGSGIDSKSKSPRGCPAEGARPTTGRLFQNVPESSSTNSVSKS
jgi:hypothetical protein